MMAFVCLPSLPIRVVPSSPATPSFEMSMLFEPLVRFSPAEGPIATFSLPVVLEESVRSPIATFSLPPVLSKSALPLATLSSPVVLANCTAVPLAMLLAPAVALANEQLDDPLPTGLTPHSLPRTFASILFALGEQPPYVMQQMRHTT